MAWMPRGTTVAGRFAPLVDVAFGATLARVRFPVTPATVGPPRLTSPISNVRSAWPSGLAIVMVPVA